MGSVVCEDIVDYSRTHHLFQTLTSTNNRRNADIEAFGHRWTDHGYDGKYNYDGTFLLNINVYNYRIRQFFLTAEFKI